MEHHSASVGSTDNNTCFKREPTGAGELQLHVQTSQSGTSPNFGMWYWGLRTSGLLVRGVEVKLEQPAI